METERRFVELRADDSVLSGVLVPYGVPSKIGGGAFTETILPGAFTIGEVRANVMHDHTRQIAVNRDGGGLVLEDGEDALRARIELPEFGDGPVIRELVARGVLTGLSVEMRVRKDTWLGKARTIHEALLKGVGIVDRPGHRESLVTLEKRWKESGNSTTRRRRKSWL